MKNTQIRSPRQSSEANEASAENVRKMLHEIAFQLHATKIIRRLPKRGIRRSILDNNHGSVS